MPDITQTESGKAWEYGLAEKSADILGVQLVINNPQNKAKKSYDLLPETEKDKIDAAAGEVVRFLRNHDARLSNAKRIVMQSDAKGRQGDVRDLLIKTESEAIGISAKHRHEAVKHPRLSDKIDFGKKWGDRPCSDTYWQEIKPIFQKLRERKKEKQLWSNVENKEEDFYYPVLQAFINEQKRNTADPEKLVSYLLGKHDFYKVIKTNGNVSVKSFNIYGGLEWGSRIKLPTRLVEIDMKPDSWTTAEMILDQGWSISFRLHNASKRVEPSLKFDIQLKGNPSELTSHTIPYSQSA